MIDRLSSEMLHATTVTKGGRAIIIAGRSGSGKSDLALRLFDRGFILVSDDQTMVRKDGTRLLASAPATIKGRLEVRGIGIIEVPTADDVPIALIVELSEAVERMPQAGLTRMILGVETPLVGIDANSASAAAKVEIALDRLGLQS
ncbi:MAG: HPr kinase/phosphatase C-terminal domain-containing protein [Pseudomonadota bacterium]